jgi:hypothetical protein
MVLEELPVVGGLTLKTIILYFEFNFFLPLIFTRITYHFVAVNVCLMIKIFFLYILPNQTVLLGHPIYRLFVLLLPPEMILRIF